MTQEDLLFAFIVALGFLLLWQARRIDRLEKVQRTQLEMNALYIQYQKQTTDILEALEKRTQR